MVSAGEPEDFVAELKEHYKNTLSIKAFSLRYHFLNKLYRSHEYWDYQTPNRVMSQRMMEVDMEKKQFYDNDILYYSGGRLFDRAQFQNDKESFYYEKSNTVYGKAVINQGMDNFDRFIRWTVMNVDFLAIRPLLEESNIAQNISLDKDSEAGTITLSHKAADNDSTDYKFRLTPLQLISIDKKSLNSNYTYDDYQTTRGVTFARSVTSYTSGVKEPAYIKYIDHFEVIDQVTQERLKLPQGYGPELPEGDGILKSTEIAKNLYLITDSSAAINSLFQVNGNKITVFGASTYSGLAEKVSKLIKAQFPDKKITSIYVSHPHGHQIAGLKIFTEQGVEILADEYTIAGIKAYPAFANEIDNFKFRPIKHQQNIAGADFYVLDNLHSKKQSFVHFKEAGIIFQAHFLHVPLDNSIAKVVPNYTRIFIDFIRAKQLNFNRIVANYRNNNIRVEVVNKTYDAVM